MPSLRVMGVSLTTVQEIWLWFLLPAILRCAAYIIDLAFAAGVLQNHFQNKFTIWGICTLIIIYAPSVVFFIMTVSRPDTWDQQRTKIKTCLWFLARIGQLLVFPGWAIYRYGKRIFWSLDALFQEGAAREQAIDKASAPSQIELYLFLHAFLHGAPQAGFQLYIILYQYDSYKQDSTQPNVGESQILCVISSLILLSLTVVSFQRFESQRLAGRKEPWHTPEETAFASTSSQQGYLSKIDTIPPFNKPKVSKAKTKTTLPKKTASPLLASDHERRHEVTLSLPAIATTSNKQLPQRCLSLPDDFPDSPPPPPPPPTNLELPKGKIRVKGLEEDDPLGMTVAFIWWLFFIVSRFLAVVTFLHIFPMWGGIVIAAHYAAFTAYLLYVSRFSSFYKVSQQFCLGSIYLYCIIEYKTKFQNVRNIYIGYFLISFIENTALSLIWWFDMEDIGFWYQFIFALIFGSFTVSMMSMGLYLALLKPKITSYFIN